MINSFELLILFLSFGHVSNASPTLHRNYNFGDLISYRMIGVSEGKVIHARVSGAVSKDAALACFEKFSWSSLVIDGKAITLTADDRTFTQNLSLDENFKTPFPKIRSINPMLYGPIFDLMTFYVDLQLAYKTDELIHAGDKKYVPYGRPASWADGIKVVLGEDCIDFDLELKSIDFANQIATVVINHVPPSHACINIPEEWMEKPIGKSPNNWIQVVKQTDGTFSASVGNEFFTVVAVIELQSGKILSARMENTVDAIVRDCKTADLNELNCSPGVRAPIFRKIELEAVK